MTLPNLGEPESSEKTTDYELFHHGVKGMRWGVRRKSGGVGTSSTKSSKPATSGDHKRARKLQSKPLSSLSNKQLKDLNTRLNLEMNYKNMTAQKSKLDRGHDRVRKGVALFGTATAIYAATQHPMTKKGMSVVKDLARQAAVSKIKRIEG